MVHARSRGRGNQVTRQLVPAKLYPIELQRELARDGMGPPELLAEETAGTAAVAETEETAGAVEEHPRSLRGAAARARQAIERQFRSEEPQSEGRPSINPTCEKGRYLPAGAARPEQLFEATWENPRGDEAAAALSEWLSVEALSTMTLPVVVTYRVEGGIWKPWTLVAESEVLRAYGLPKGSGLWVLQPHMDGDRLPDYEGISHGAYRSEAEAARAAMKSKSRHIITTRREDGRWATLDGAPARSGGVQMLNDIRGTGRPADVSIYADRSVAVRSGRKLTPLRAGQSTAEREAAEVLTDYGTRYWRAFGLKEPAQVAGSLSGLDWVAAAVWSRC